MARFTLTLDKHLFSDLDWGTMGRSAKGPRKGDHTTSAGRPREELLYPVLRPRRPPLYCMYSTYRLLD